MLSKKIFTRLLQGDFKKLYCTSTELKYKDASVKKTISPKKSNFPKSQRITSTIHQYLIENNADYLFPHIPSILMRKCKKSRSSSYLINPVGAKEFADLISSDLLRDPSYVIETNPGLGILTEELLNSKVPLVHLYERYEEFLKSSSPLVKLLEKYPSRLKIRKLNFFDVWSLLLHDYFYNENLAQEYLADVPKKNWEDECFAQIIAICSSREFLYKMCKNFAFQTEIFDHGRPKFYLALPQDVWDRVTRYKQHKSRYYSSLQAFVILFFDYEELGQLSENHCVPRPHRNSKDGSVDIPHIIIKLEPKTNVYSMLPKEDMQSFWFFLRSVLRSRDIKVINEFEKMIPGSGARLIEQDITICTICKELKPEKLLEVFKCFRTWTEYDPVLFTPPDIIEDSKKENEKDNEKGDSDDELD